MKRIRVSHVAERDLDDIWYYIVKTSGSMEIAGRLGESITETFPLFAQAPQAGTGRDEIAPGLRGFPVPPPAGPMEANIEAAPAQSRLQSPGRWPRTSRRQPSQRPLAPPPVDFRQ
jgi:plasmid stabilization system protein ParE